MVDARTQKGKFEKYLREAEEASFSGWDFSYICTTGRITETPLKWNYHNIVCPYLEKAKTMLDMGTGGGEVLSSFAPLPPTTYATEQYHPNVAIAKKKLGPLGVNVLEIAEEESPPYNSKLPFKNGFLDLIINRHEAYFPPELMRILKTGGYFITQQVGSLTNINLVQYFQGKTVPVSNWNLKSAADELKASGFNIIKQVEDINFYRFFDIGAIVYYLKAIPWTIEDFSIKKYKDKLWELHLRINEDGYYDATQHRFLVVAQK